ncbi:calcyclin-binding protein [Centruroides vittatus]|uniref:calcyclin-binding protein n=1 Tax=Centruroides vittatus TaxID=120091 RepID=UPI003510C32B
MSKLEEMKKDLEELEILRQQAKRTYVKDFLCNQIQTLQNDIKKKEMFLATATSPESEKRSKQLCNVKIVNYGWDQSDKFVKLYVTLKNVQKLPSENIKTNFTTKSVELHVYDLDNKNHTFTINNLMGKIMPDKCYFKAKTDMVVIFLKKESSSNWQYITEAERKSNETKMPEMDENEDPGQSLMNLMKKMYDEGDDEMKKTIAKTWMEAREKQARGDYSLPNI